MEGSERGQCHCLASGGFPSTCPISSHLTHSPYVTDTLPAVALVLNPRVGGFAYILRLCGPFRQSFLKIWQFLPLPPPALIFTARSYGDLSSWCWNPGLCSLVLGWDRFFSRYPSWLLSTTHDCGTARAHSAATLPLCATLCLLASLPLLHISAPPTCLDECGFFKSLVVGFPYSFIFWLFWVLFAWKFSCNLFLWLHEEAKHVHICLHFDWKSSHPFLHDTERETSL